ncbi:3-oxoacyl-[acyl-carrier-protein] synthase 3 protein 1 [Paenibacillus plantiphilus]|uniref:Beta-ketoacyl-[acyl-carrier-protein] synthase III n=1 Tax=Paenibacillus plantiphilus TaxID=2905650 RepID=A0ABM9C0F5_9BACL|nr:beta-ketoacyl-ACP synthase III [Paenibacillus plantiphilus]CAH1197890.1 3-oxoacyl-[acyl-carrier-protein] synthase 3 protein 1 [Paenibacillus plantiphilus]
MQLNSVGIIGTGKYVPERILSNKELEQMVETNDEWIVTRTGIRERRIAAPEQATSDLAFNAAEIALKAAGITAAELDLIIVATITPDMFFPSTACLLQEKLGATKAAAFDLSAACSGFIYGLATANSMIASGMYKHVLVVGAECLSRITDYTDRNTCILFGDGAGAVVLGPVPEGRGFRSFELGADGSGGELLKVCGGGSRVPSTEASIAEKQHYIYMAGSEVFKFAVRIMGNAAEEALSKAGIDKGKIDLLIPHQANIRIIQSALNKLSLSEDKCMINLDKYGNVSAASIPIALAEAVEQGRVNEGDCLVLVGFGGGLTWGASVLVW